MIKKFSLFAVILTLALALCACGSKDDPDATPTPAPTLAPELTEGAIEATITLETGDEIELELYPNVAPETVENFVDLAEDGFYDGLIFHRVIEDFMIQGGGYDENLKEQKASTIDGEFSSNGFDNPLSHTRGVISMARAQQFDSASSQFFIVQEDSTYLDGQYAAFGVVTDGMDVVDDIASVRTGSVSSSGMENVPVDPIVIESITIGGSSSSSKKDKDSDTDTDKDDKDTDKNSSKDDEDEDTKSSSKSSKSSDKDTNESDELTNEEIINSLFGSGSGSSGSSSSSSSSKSSSSGI